MRIKASKIKAGEEYFFPDTEFNYSKQFETRVTKERINQVIGSQFSTRNIGDRYERERVIGFTTEQEANRYLIQRIKERKKQIDTEYREAIKKLSDLNLFV